MDARHLIAWPWERIARHLVSGLILVAALYLAVMDKTASATVMAALFVVTHLLTNIDKLNSFAAFGVNAELREVIKEVQLTIEQARRMALTSASQTFYLYAIQGRLMGADWRRKDELIQKLNANMADIGVDASEVREARKELFEFAQYDIISTVQRRLDTRLQAQGVPYDDCPDSVSYAGEDFTAFDKLIDLILTVSALDNQGREALLQETRAGREALRKSIEAGFFTEEALVFLEE